MVTWAVTNPVYITTQDKDTPTVVGLKQGYVLCPLERRLDVLHNFLVKNSAHMKILVFCSSWLSVEYHSKILNWLEMRVERIHVCKNDICLSVISPVATLQAEQAQEKRTSIFYRYCKAATGVLLCTDIAARGLDIPDVHWVVHFDPPRSVSEYIHRVGRVIRGEGARGGSCLILRKEEKQFVNHLKTANVPIANFNLNWDGIEEVNSEVVYIYMFLEKLYQFNYVPFNLGRNTTTC